MQDNKTKSAQFKIVMDNFKKFFEAHHSSLSKKYPDKQAVLAMVKSNPKVVATDMAILLNGGKFMSHLFHKSGVSDGYYQKKEQEKNQGKKTNPFLADPKAQAELQKRFPQKNGK